MDSYRGQNQRKCGLRLCPGSDGLAAAHGSPAFILHLGVPDTFPGAKATKSAETAFPTAKCFLTLSLKIYRHATSGPAVSDFASSATIQDRGVFPRVVPLPSSSLGDCDESLAEDPLTSALMARWGECLCCGSRPRRLFPFSDLCGLWH